MGRIIAENKHTGKLYPVDSKAIYRVIYEVVDVLPTENIKTSVIYCVPIIEKENEYDMFLYINSDWVSVGSGSIDLSDYYTKEETTELLSDKMDLAPINPTAEQIAAMAGGQIYGDTVNHKGIVKGGQEFYDSVYIDENYRRTFIDNEYNPPYRVPSTVNDFKIGDKWVNIGQGRSFVLVSVSTSDNFKHYNWKPENNVFIKIPNQPQVGDEFPSRTIDSEKWIYNPTWFIGDIVFNEKQGTSVSERLWTLRNLIVSVTSLITCSYKWQEISISENTYTKNEIDNMIGDIETALSEV